MAADAALNHRFFVIRGLVAIVALAAVLGRADARDLPLRAFTTADGLVDDRTHRLMFDSRGLLWVCTSGGLSTFDGSRFHSLGLAEGLPFPSINDLLELPDGELWLATNGGGVIRVSIVAGRPRYEQVRVGDTPATNRVNRLFRTSRGVIWAGTDGGLFRVSTAAAEAPRFSSVRLRLRGRPDEELQIWDFAEDAEATLWVGTRLGLVRILGDGRAIAYRVGRDPGTDHVQTLLYTSDGLLWIAHQSGLGILKVPAAPAPDGSSSRTIEDPVFDRLVASDLAMLDAQSAAPQDTGAARFFGFGQVGGPTLVGLAQSPSGSVDVVTSGAVFEFSAGRVVRVLRDERLRSMLFSGAVFDREANLWVGTNGAGVVRVAANGFETYRTEDGVGQLVSTLFETHAGDLIAVSRDWRVGRFEGDHFHSVRVNMPPAAQRAGWQSNLGVLEDRSGDWWFATGAGLVRFRGVRGIDDLTTASPTLYTTRDGLGQEDITLLFEDSRGGIWSGGLIPGRTVVTRWDRASNRFRGYSDADGLPPFNSALYIFEDAHGRIWIVLRDGGIARLDGDRFHVLTEADGVPPGNPGVARLDRAGRLWCSSVLVGLFRIDDLDATPLRHEIVLTARDLGADRITRLSDAPDGSLYAATTRGLLWIGAATSTMPSRILGRYTTADGLAEGQSLAAFVDHARRIWFATPKGVSVRDARADPPRRAPEVRIGELRVAGVAQPVFPGGEEHLDRVELVPGQSQLEVGFFGVSFATADALSYEHRLVGGDDAWSTPSPASTIVFSNLPAGRYDFEVRAVSTNGQRSPRPARVSFRVLPPIWRRWWFLSLAGTSAAAVAIAFERSRAAHRRAIDSAREERLVEMENVRRRIAADLHDEIGSSLTQISILSEVARRRGAAVLPELADPLSNIAASSRELVDSMSDIVWAINPGKDHLSDLTQRMRRHAADVFTAGDVVLQLRLPPPDREIKLGANLRREAFLIYKEAVNNVVKHAACTEVAITLAIEPGSLHLEVRDNGGGFDSAAPTDGHGLASLHARAAALGGRLMVVSAPGAGTTVTLDLPIPT